MPIPDLLGDVVLERCSVPARKERPTPADVGECCLVATRHLEVAATSHSMLVLMVRVRAGRFVCWSRSWPRGAGAATERAEDVVLLFDGLDELSV